MTLDIDTLSALGNMALEDPYVVESVRDGWALSIDDWDQPVPYGWMSTTIRLATPDGPERTASVDYSQYSDGRRGRAAAIDVVLSRVRCQAIGLLHATARDLA